MLIILNYYIKYKTGPIKKWDKLTQMSNILHWKPLTTWLQMYCETQTSKTSLKHLITVSFLIPHVWFVCTLNENYRWNLLKLINLRLIYNCFLQAMRWWCVFLCEFYTYIQIKCIFFYKIVGKFNISFLRLTCPSLFECLTSVYIYQDVLGQ